MARAAYISLAFRVALRPPPLSTMSFASILDPLMLSLQGRRKRQSARLCCI
jgi:hypothetical protein